jgi:translocation and assembly module TamA
VSILALAWLLGGCVHAPPTPDSREVESLTIEGTKQLDEDELKKKLLTGPSSWVPGWVPVLGHTDWFDPSAWQADLRRISRFYEANGYYQARLLDEDVSITPDNKVKLTVKLREGAPALIASLALEGLDALSAEQRATVTADLPLQLKAPFIEEKWTATKLLLASRLRELGYATAVVVGEALVDADAARVDITLTATPGTRFHFGKVFVATDSGAQVPARLIADVASPDVKPGDWFSESALQEAQGHVFQMGVFSGVKVNRGAPDTDKGEVPVVIDVREAPFNSARVGFGLGGDLIRQEVRVVGEYTNRNLGLSRLFSPDARLDRLTIKGKLGWTFLPTVWDVAAGNPAAKNGPTARILTEYEVPRLFGLRTLTFQGSLELSRMLDAAYDYFGGEAKLGVVWRPRRDVSVFPSLNFDAYVLNTQVSVRDNVPPAVLGCPLNAACIISYIDLTADFDRRDEPLAAKEGFYFAVSVQAGLASTSSVKPYLRIVPEARGYVSFGKDKRVTLAAKVRVGTLISTDEDTPVVARFFSGGSNMRGFSTRRLSPQVAVPKSVQIDDPSCPSPSAPVQPSGCPRKIAAYDYNDGETLPIGGNGLAEASLELRWNVWGDLVLAVFTDWGLVTAAPLGPKTNLATQLYAAVGLGVRYKTPLGPIRLDLGVRLPFIGQPIELQTGDVKLFKSNPGCFFNTFAAAPVAQATALPYAGSPDNLCNVHLSIGEAF